jgi:hypothetical protein
MFFHEIGKSFFEKYPNILFRQRFLKTFSNYNKLCERVSYEHMARGRQTV